MCHTRVMLCHTIFVPCARNRSNCAISCRADKTFWILLNMYVCTIRSTRFNQPKREKIKMTRLFGHWRSRGLIIRGYLLLPSALFFKVQSQRDDWDSFSRARPNSAYGPIHHSRPNTTSMPGLFYNIFRSFRSPYISDVWNTQ